MPVLPEKDQERILEICRKRKVLIKILCNGDFSRTTFPFFKTSYNKVIASAKGLKHEKKKVNYRCDSLTLVIVLYVREGIVIASDSRLTLDATRQEGERQVVQMAVGQSDTNYKIFLTKSNVGITAHGQAEINGVPLAGYIESFINEHLTETNSEVDQIPQELLGYFRNLPSIPNTCFLVAGYKKVENTWEQQIWQIKITTNQVTKLNPQGGQGATWGGEGDVLARLVQQLGVRKPDGTYEALPHHQIQWGYFTLQDAIDYCIYAVKVTIDTMRFHPRAKTVGGPIDVLVIKPNDAKWVQRKALHV